MNLRAVPKHSRMKGGAAFSAGEMIVRDNAPRARPRGRVTSSLQSQAGAEIYKPFTRNKTERLFERERERVRRDIGGMDRQRLTGGIDGYGLASNFAFGVW